VRSQAERCAGGAHRPAPEAGEGRLIAPQAHGAGCARLEHGIVDFRPLEKRETKKRRARASTGALTFMRYLRRHTSRWVFEQERELRVGRKVTLRRRPIVDVKKAFNNAVVAVRLGGVNIHHADAHLLPAPCVKLPGITAEARKKSRVLV
jgi:hypothetical protein